MRIPSLPLQLARAWVVVALVAFALAACSGGEDDDDGDSTAGGDGTSTSLLQVVHDGAAADDSPDTIFAGRSATISYWTDGSTGQPEQGLYESEDGVVKVRAQYDAAGEPVRLDDENGGGFYLVDRIGTDRVDMLRYDNAGQYLGGKAIFLEGGKLWVGTITGRPALSDGLLLGSLSVDGAVMGTWTLSSAMAIDDGLADIRELDETDYRVLAAFLGEESTVAAGAPAARSELTPFLSAVRNNLPKVGLILMGSSLAVGGADAGAFFAAGAVMAGVGYGAGLLEDAINKHFEADTPAQQEVVDTGLETLSDSSPSSLANFRTNLRERISDGLDYVNESLADARSNARNYLDSLSDYGRDLANRASPPEDPSEGPAAIGGPVSGEARMSDETTYHLDGTVDADGHISTSGVDAAGGEGTMDLELDLDAGAAEGSFETSRGASGSADGAGVDRARTGLVVITLEPGSTLMTTTYEGMMAEWCSVDFVGPADPFRVFATQTACGINGNILTQRIHERRVDPVDSSLIFERDYEFFARWAPYSP